MWYDDKLKEQGYLLWSKDDLSEFGTVRDGMQFKMHGRNWVVIDSMPFSSSGNCKISLQK